jgi:tetratricopeptide (TPR) repeat protein
MDTDINYLDSSLGACDRGEIEKAIEIATEGIEHASDFWLSYGPGKVELYRLRATYYDFARNYEAAIQDVTTVISICLGGRYHFYKGLASCFSYRAYLYFQMENYHQAVADYSRALESEEILDWRINLGRAYAALGNKEAAAKDYQRALEFPGITNPMTVIIQSFMDQLAE